MVTGNPFKRLENVWKCCKASTVVGTKTATCLESLTALKAARIATSVFPKPTSPHTKRSIGDSFSMSRFTSMVALSWSGVSSYINDASNSVCRYVSGMNWNPCEFLRSAYSFISSRAMSLTLLLVLAFSLFQAFEPSLLSDGSAPSLLEYFEILCSE